MIPPSAGPRRVLWAGFRVDAGAGARAGSYDDLTATAEQITNENRTREPREFLDEAERRLSFCSRRSLELAVGEM